MDFYRLRLKRSKDGNTYIYPDFVVQRSKDLLVKGRSFYAVWDEAAGLWSRDEMTVVKAIDTELWERANTSEAIPLLMDSYESDSWKTYKQYVGSLTDSDVELDQTLAFADDPVNRDKYTSRRLPYSLSDGPAPAWEEIVSTLYDPVEREKIEWAIGSIVSGDSKKNQKFLVFYGPPGAGKGTILNIVEKLFEGYSIPFDAKAMTSGNNSFALAGFKNSPLVAIQQDGDLSKLDDNTRLNSIVSHEILPINEKYKAEYYARALAFLMLGTNEPVKITNAKSGILRRLIDCYPSGRHIPNNRYHILTAQVDFELGQIAKHCLDVYLRLGKNYYGNYRPVSMMYETDVFYNYVEHVFDTFYLNDGVTLDQAWQLYKDFCDDSLIRYKMQRHQFRSELNSYFDEFHDRYDLPDGTRVRSYYKGFRTHKFVKADDSKPLALTLDEKDSLLDDILKDCKAQYATQEGTPKAKWDNVTTTLSDIDTSQLHYALVPEEHIIIDFDLKDEHGNKSLERNLVAAAEWPATYAELSQGGGGVHLHYNWRGADGVGSLATHYRDGIEVKSLLGNSSLRRRVTRCNNVAVADISSGLPIKEKPMHDSKAMTSEKSVRKLIIENLQKKHHAGTKPSIDFIDKILKDAYASGIPYDVSDMYADIHSFAMDSSNNARYCMDVVQTMPMMSEDMELKIKANDERIAFYDVEVFPNLFVVCWKFAGSEASMVRMINPSPAEIDGLLGLKLVGFNCRRYDNHILYARAMGYSLEQLYDLSQRIISNDKAAMFGAAYDVSYTDIYDFSSIKQSLKKFEIDLGIHHMELGLPWDEPVPEEKWDLVAEYCCNDVVATEATFEDRKADFLARRILSDISGLSVNSSTNSHSTRIIFGSNRKPQSAFKYTDLGKVDFPGYKYDFGKSTYRDEIVGEGGYVYAEPGVYKDVALLDVASMHPASIENLNLFGDEYTARFSEVKNARVAIKRGDIDGAKRMLEGKLTPYLEDQSQHKGLSDALKIVINSVYGLTAARFENPFKDSRNNDNVVAKRGALFMVDLKHAVQEQGFTVAHIKTDSIKIPNATPEIIQFVFDFGTKYGYEFEHEATYEEFVLFNDAVYIAKDTDGWHATGAQFQHPYVFKTMLSHEPLEFHDFCETKNVIKGHLELVKGEGENESRQFVGRIGSFVPIKAGGARLVRVTEVTDKETGEKSLRDYGVNGTVGFEWMEAELVKDTEFENAIDMAYFQGLVDKARKALDGVGYPPWDPS